MSKPRTPANYKLTNALSQAKTHPVGIPKRYTGGKLIPAFNGHKSRKPITLPKVEK